MTRKLAISLYYEIETEDNRPIKDIEDTMQELIFDALDLFESKLNAVVVVHEVKSDG